MTAIVLDNHQNLSRVNSMNKTPLNIMSSHLEGSNVPVYEEGSNVPVYEEASDVPVYGMV